MSMDPLNQKERAAAQRKFMGVYLLSILIPCIAVYFLAQSSDNRLEGVLSVENATPMVCYWNDYTKFIGWCIWYYEILTARAVVFVIILAYCDHTNS